MESRLPPLLTLDTIWSAAFHFTVKWSSHLQSNQARDLLKYLVTRLYDHSRGQLMNAQIELAQTTVARKLNISRQWVGELSHRLAETGWLEYSSEKLPDGTNGSSVWRIGRQLKRLLVMLAKSKQLKSPIKTDAKSTWHFSPHPREKKILAILDKEKEPPSEKILEKMPLLKRWLARGKGAE
jgi:Mn-dependent DtxR family transcriptional regulator